MRVMNGPADAAVDAEARRRPRGFELVAVPRQTAAKTRAGPNGRRTDNRAKLLRRSPAVRDRGLRQGIQTRPRPDSSAEFPSSAGSERDTMWRIQKSRQTASGPPRRAAPTR